MSLQQTLKEQALTLANQPQPANGLEGFRQAQLSEFSTQEFPTRKTERWKYTSLHTLESGHLEKSLAGKAKTQAPVFDATTVTIRNGDIELPTDLPAGIEILSLAKNAEQAATEFNTLFSHLNGATLTDGILINVSKNTVLEKPIHLVHVADAPNKDQHSHTAMRVVVSLGESAQATIIEHFLGNGPVLTNAVTRYNVAANAKLTHYRLSAESNDSLHIGLLEFEQQRDSRIESFQFMQGNTLRRHDIHAVIAESGADLQMKGIYVARGNSHIDNQVCVEHRVPHCTSNQVFKGMAGETSKGIFNGRIHIHEGAKGTNAELSNNNLLLNPGAEIDSKPELEIYNDDVKCAHGTTVGQMDASQLFYLRSRGIEEHAAKRMLAEGFVNELIEAIPDEEVREWVQPWLAKGLTENL